MEKRKRGPLRYYIKFSFASHERPLYVIPLWVVLSNASPKGEAVREYGPPIKVLHTGPLLTTEASPTLYYIQGRLS